MKYLAAVFLLIFASRGFGQATQLAPVKPTYAVPKVTKSATRVRVLYPVNVFKIRSPNLRWKGSGYVHMDIFGNPKWTMQNDSYDLLKACGFEPMATVYNGTFNRLPIYTGNNFKPMLREIPGRDGNFSDPITPFVAQAAIQIAIQSPYVPEHAETPVLIDVEGTASYDFGRLPIELFLKFSKQFGFEIPAALNQVQPRTGFPRGYAPEIESSFWNQELTPQQRFKVEHECRITVLKNWLSAMKVMRRHATQTRELYLYHGQFAGTIDSHYRHEDWHDKDVLLQQREEFLFWDAELQRYQSGVAMSLYNWDQCAATNGRQWYKDVQAADGMIDKYYPQFAKNKIALYSPNWAIYWPKPEQPWKDWHGKPLPEALMEAQIKFLVDRGWDIFLWVDDTAVENAYPAAKILLQYSR